jgi:uncharacterized SAM-binding protein YcdF (DUF218 family)
VSTELQLFLSKALPLLALPEGLIAIALIGACLCALRGALRTAGALSAVALAIFWTSATPVVAHWLMASLEQPFAVDSSTLPRVEVGIVLGGAVNSPQPPRQEPELGEAADRVWHAARLYHAGHVKQLVVVGGNLPWSRSARPEAELIRDLLVGLGVPEVRIRLGGGSRNTYENAVEASSILQGPPFPSTLLITSAFHMPRALSVFRKAGIHVDAAPCDFRAAGTLSGTLLDWTPQARALAMTSDAIREWIGFHVYRWRGWL